MSEIGKKITSLRKEKSISIEELSENSSISASQIESIENGDLLPTLPMIVDICRSLNINADKLLDGVEDISITITHKNPTSNEIKESTSRISLSKEDSTLKYFSLAPTKTNRVMDPFVIELDAESYGEVSTHEGEEFVYIIHGDITLKYGDESYELKAGDSIYYDSVVPHQFKSNSERAKLVAVVYKPV